MNNKTEKYAFTARETLLSAYLFALALALFGMSWKYMGETFAILMGCAVAITVIFSWRALCLKPMKK